MLQRLLLLAVIGFSVTAASTAEQRLDRAAADSARKQAATQRAAIPAWYPPECGAIDYCGAVDHVFWIAPADGHMAQLMIRSAHGTAAVERSFQVQDSRDRRMHVCMRYGPFGDLEVTCLLVPNQTATLVPSVPM